MEMHLRQKWSEIDDILLMLRNISKMTLQGEHFQALAAISDSLSELLKGLALLSGSQLYLPMAVLGRSILHTSVSGILLAQNSEQLETFRSHGRYTKLRILMSEVVYADLEDTERKRQLKRENEDELKLLKAKFQGKNEWHGMSFEVALKAAGFDLSLYDAYYRSASAVAHGQPHTVVTHLLRGPGVFKRNKNSDISQAALTYFVAGESILRFLSEVSSRFNLSLDSKIQECRAALEKFEKGHIQAIKDAVAKQLEQQRD